MSDLASPTEPELLARQRACTCTICRLRNERDRFRDALTLIASPNRAIHEQPLDAWKIAWDALDEHREFDS